MRHACGCDRRISVKLQVNSLRVILHWGSSALAERDAQYGRGLEILRTRGTNTSLIHLSRSRSRLEALRLVLFSRSSSSSEGAGSSSDEDASSSDGSSSSSSGAGSSSESSSAYVWTIGPSSSETPSPESVSAKRINMPVEVSHSVIRQVDARSAATCATSWLFEMHGERRPASPWRGVVVECCSTLAYTIRLAASTYGCDAGCIDPSDSSSPLATSGRLLTRVWPTGASQSK